MFKKIISSVMTAAMLLGVFASCTTVEKTEFINSAISVATSDAKEYAVWLSDRLDTVPDDVTVGVGNNESYGIDMENFEDDGYVIKRVGDDVVIFGATAEGLDCGVRKYANMIDLEGVAEDKVFHEGYRIDKFEIFGTDISEFVIEYPVENNANMTFAVSELQQLVKKACGAELEAVEGTADAEHKIIFRHTDDESLEDDGYRYFEENGNLVIEGAVARGCMYGVYRFLQNECGWEGLTYGYSELLESDLVSIPEGINESEVPAFEMISIYHNMCKTNQYTTDRTEISENSAENSYGPFGRAGHGIHQWTFSPERQICYLEESRYDEVYTKVMDYLDTCEKKGEIIGKTVKDIDISQGDNNLYCLCAKCMDLMSEELSLSGGLLRFANQLAEDVNSVYDNVAIHIFGYFSTKIPPAVTKAHEMVYVTFAQNGNCSNHPMDGSECYGEIPSYGFNDHLDICNNKLHHEWLSGWCDASDNVIVWYYNLPKSSMFEYTLLDVVLDDMRYMDELGIYGIFFESEYVGSGIKRVEHQIYQEINWNLDMSYEEYEQVVRDMLRKEYGAGVDPMMEYMAMWVEAMDRIGCDNCWGSGPLFDLSYMCDVADECNRLAEKVVSLAENKDQEYRAKLMTCHVYLESILSQYFPAYENNDTEKLAELEETYKFLLNRIDEIGFTPVWGYQPFNPNLEELVWNEWTDWRNATHTRPAPDWVTQKAPAASETAEATSES